MPEAKAVVVPKHARLMCLGREENHFARKHISSQNAFFSVCESLCHSVCVIVALEITGA